MKNLTILFLTLIFLMSCGENKKESDTTSKDKKETGTEQNQKTASVNIDKFAGTYVDGSYDKRSEGYDWVGVIVSKWSDSTLYIKVRSRTDKKKATCTFSGMAKMKDENTFEGMYDANGVSFSFTKDSVKIFSEKPDDDSKLFYFCSGGGSLEGSYAKISGTLDRSQMDSMSYTRTLNYNDMLFEVKASENDKGQNNLMISQIGAKDKNSEFTFPFEGTISNTEIGDINGDNFPEILFYIASNDKSRKGSIVGFSSNNGKSLSMTGLLNFMDDTTASKGYRGHDEFAIVEGTLVQRFPVYADGAPENAEPVKTRQIQYKLVDGEALREFRIDKITEY